MYDAIYEETVPTPPRLIHTIKVIVLLLLVATVFSYLGAFALTSALVTADLLERWPPSHDPRPGWMLTGFTAMTGAFALIGLWLKWSSWRQLRRLDCIDRDEG